jgi:predicted ATPase
MATIDAHHRIVGHAITTNNGRVDHTEGDAFVAIFSDPAAALAAATQAQRELRQHEWPDSEGLRVRMGLHTGTVVRHSTGYVGLDVHLAARVAAAANGGQILITAATLREARGSVEVRDLGPHRLKDFPEPERLYHVVLEGVPEETVPTPRSASVRPTNLPPQTGALIGRERECVALSELLRNGRRSIVSLIGVGGIGKTRLAVAVARDLLDELPGGVFLVRLAGISDPRSILPMIAQAVGVIGQSDAALVRLLADRLGESPTLIILDNFEQLVASAAVVSDLVDRGSELRILVTSQVALRVAVERTLLLGPLAPEDAVSLFVERSRVVAPEFHPTAADLPTVEEICNRLDCMPLAIELAAARTGSLAPAELAVRLERPLGLLTRANRDAPERQRSLRATIEWTHALLDPGPRSLFADLGVCAGAVPLTAVEALAACGRSPEMLDALDDLLAFSFARRQEDRNLGVRFMVPQALRDYALERLIESGEEPQVRRVHAEYVWGVAHTARLWKWGPTTEQRTALLSVGDEIRPAVAWARAHDPVLYVRICAALASYWTFAGVLSEVAQELQASRESGVGSAADRAWIVTLLAKTEQMAGAHERAHELSAAATAAWDELEDRHERALGLGPLSWVLRWDGRHEEAIDLARESLETLRCSGDWRLELRGLVFLAHALANGGDAEATEAVLGQAIPLARGDPQWELAAIQGDCAQLRGDHLAALALYAENLSWSSTTRESHQMLMDMRDIATELARLNRCEEAVEVHELVRLEEHRTGRVGTMPIALQWLADAITGAKL